MGYCIWVLPWLYVWTKLGKEKTSHVMREVNQQICTTNIRLVMLHQQLWDLGNQLVEFEPIKKVSKCDGIAFFPHWTNFFHRDCRGSRVAVPLPGNEETLQAQGNNLRTFGVWFSYWHGPLLHSTYRDSYKDRQCNLYQYFLAGI